MQTILSTPNAIIDSSIEALMGIKQDSKNIAICQRDISKLASSIAILESEKIKFQHSGKIEDIIDQLKQYLRSFQLSDDALLEDISMILSTFRDTSEADTFKLLLVSVSTDMCRKFHTDVNDLRLLCSYSGPGTLWVSEDTEQWKSPKQQEARVQIKESDIHQANTGDIVILKGALYPNARPVMHKSPSIQNNGETRIMLRIDTNSFARFIED